MGDIFHFIDRIKVPIHHELKKAWKAALSRSFFIFDEKIMKIVTDALKKSETCPIKISKKCYITILSSFANECPVFVPHRQYFTTGSELFMMSMLTESIQVAGRKILLDRGVNEVGPYQSPMEDGMQHFHEWYRSQIAL